MSVSEPQARSKPNSAASGAARPQQSKPAAGRPSGAIPRLASLDAYRGFIMLAMASGGLGFAAVAKSLPANDPHYETWQWLAHQTDHVPWLGCVFWDLIQPSFMFMVGVAMAFSYSSRLARGQSYLGMFGHAVWRSVALVLLAVFLSSNWSSQTNWVFTNVLAQIGLGYAFLFLLWNRPAAVQLAAAVLILVADWALFYFYPLPPEGFDYARVGVSADWDHLQGLAAHWDKNTNAAADFDVWLLNKFPREKPFEFNEGGYTTLNFVPSLATMILGLMTGGLLRGGQGRMAKFGWLVVAGGACLGAGYALHHFGLCPLVKRIWTPSWAVYSAGWAMLMLAGFYLAVDLLGLRWLAWPLIVVGMNSILIYCMSQLIGGGRGWIAQSLQRHFGKEVFTFYGKVGDVYSPVVTMSLVLLVMWLACAWLYRQKVFIRI